MTGDRFVGLRAPDGLLLIRQRPGRDPVCESADGLDWATPRGRELLVSTLLVSTCHNGLPAEARRDFMARFLPDGSAVRWVITVEQISNWAYGNPEWAERLRMPPPF